MRTDERGGAQNQLKQSSIFQALNAVGSEVSQARPKKSWNEYLFQAEQDSCNLIHPSSKFAHMLLVISTIFLV